MEQELNKIFQPFKIQWLLVNERSPKMVLLGKGKRNNKTKTNIENGEFETTKYKIIKERPSGYKSQLINLDEGYKIQHIFILFDVESELSENASGDVSIYVSFANTKKFLNKNNSFLKPVS